MIWKGMCDMILSFIDGCRKVVSQRVQEVSPHRHCLNFFLNGVRFGIDTRVVNGIARYRMLAEPRGMPGSIRGLFRHNGAMVPVIDIAAHYGNQPLRPGGRTCIVLTELGVGKWRRDIGLMVDEISGVSEFGAPELLPVPEAAHRMLQVEIVEGLVKQKKDYLVVLDAWRLLPDAALEELGAYMQREYGREM
jgi:purine-binding chemotaxis protein CheW